MKELAVVDLGSNSLRMGIYTVKNSVVKEIEKYREQVRLAQGLEKDNLLQKQPIERTIKVFKEFRKILDSKGINNVYTIATECLRRAKNRDEFILEVKNAAGFDINVLDGETEALYCVNGAMQSVPDLNDFYVLDTGGGSFELSKVIRRQMTDFVCLPYGCVVLTERFAPDYNGDKCLSEFLENVVNKISWLNEPLPIVTLGGSVKELASYTLKMRWNFDGKKISSSLAQDTYNLLYLTPVSLRSEKFGIDIQRADLIVAGLSPLMSIINKTNSPYIYFSTKGVREGAATSLLLKND